jgi:hypothetical protein
VRLLISPLARFSSPSDWGILALRSARFKPPFEENRANSGGFAVAENRC